jgi:DNA polymerase-1
MKFKQLKSEAEVRSLIDWHNANSKYVVLDTETTSKNPREAKLLDIQMSGRGEDEAVLFSGDYLLLLRELKPTCVWWNMKYDLIVAHRHGVDLRGLKNEDGMLLHHLLDENSEHDLDSLVQAQFGDRYKEEFWEKYENYLDAPFEERIQYACKDIVYTGRIYRHISKALDVDGIPAALRSQVHRLALALLGTELHGIKVDLEYTVEMGTALKADIVGTERQLRELGGYHCDIIELRQWAKEIEKVYSPGPRATKWKTLPKPDFNFQSPAQVVQLLYYELGLPKQLKWDRKSKQERLTTEDDALAEIEHHHPLVPLLRGYKKKTKMYGSFVEGVLDKAVGDTLYPGFNVNGTVTGRISHMEPNMGQMPSKGEWVKIRGIFVPPPGHKLITCDYGQLEVCVEAHFSHDKQLLKILNEGLSKHDITASEVGLPRGTAKTLNFAMQYRCEPPKVAEIVGCSKAEGEKIHRRYWEVYAGVERVYQECAAKVDRGEPIVNPYGRKRHLPREFRNKWERAAACRQAYSSLIQGTGADMTSDAFTEIDAELVGRQWGRGWYTVHDECLGQTLEQRVEESRELFRSKMLGIGPKIGLSVPLTVDCSEGLERWTK